MGATHANILHHIETEFETAVTEDSPEDQSQPHAAVDEDDAAAVWAEYDRIERISRTHNIGLQKLLAMRQVEGLPVDFLHIGVLHLIDNDQTGQFGLSKLKGFAHWCASNITGQLEDAAFAEEVQALATLQMWEQYRRQGEMGCEYLAEWLLEVARHSTLGVSGEGGGNGCTDTVLNKAHVSAICSLLSAADSGIDQQSLATLFCMASTEGEGEGDDSTEGAVSVAAVRPFLQQFASSYFTLLGNLGLDALL